MAFYLASLAATSPCSGRRQYIGTVTYRATQGGGILKQCLIYRFALSVQLQLCVKPLPNHAPVCGMRLALTTPTGQHSHEKTLNMNRL
ncbi:hypothetical protein Mfla_2367 [Methylobacillus flagellatus KT]|uniref:Uncharacterized protein n=1 Tax=Methylobacillus flagellatus (strain ATCC 51484 / DSM 6875 / VKM B-1610 / KT) TaxID=265072 RepID=Q1GYQ3_METFK|nr:hypothetical protein Mfla_2367 [Methylobacillus flagellatus KT]